MEAKSINNTTQSLFNLSLVKRQKYKIELGTFDRIVSEYLKTLCELRAHSDKLPAEKVDWSHPDFPCMKCRGATLSKQLHLIDRMLDLDIIQDPRIHIIAQDFMNYPFQSQKKNGFVTPEDIAYMNRTLDVLIKHLCSHYGIERPIIDFEAMVLERRANMAKTFTATMKWHTDNRES